jgi:hypothetical protein
MNRTSERVLVLGCSAFSHIDSCEWQNQVVPNIPDYDLVIVSEPHLTEDILKIMKGEFLKNLRKAFVQLLHSGGKIIALVSPRVRVERPKMYPEYVSTRDWCPIAYATREEVGKSIITKSTEYATYLKTISEWSFYLEIPHGCVSDELTDFYGSTHSTRYNVPLIGYLENRYGRVLAGHFHVEVRQPRTQSNDWGDTRTNYSKDADFTTGKVVLLPLISKVTPEEALGNILREEIGLTLESPEPDWAKNIELPGVPELMLQIAEVKSSIEHEARAARDLETQVSSLRLYRRLLYASGSELEMIVGKSLEKLGGKVLPSKYSEEEYILEFEGNEFLIEVKGVTKSISLTHIRQLNDYLLKYQEDTGKQCKGILFGNPWRNTPPELRGLGDTPEFPDNVVQRAEQWGIALVSSTTFFRAFVQALKSPELSKYVLNKMTTSSGIAYFA